MSFLAEYSNVGRALLPVFTHVTGKSARPTKRIRTPVRVLIRANSTSRSKETASGRRAYVDLHLIAGCKESVDQNHVKYFLDLEPGEKRLVTYSVTYKRRKVAPKSNQEKRRE